MKKSLLIAFFILSCLSVLRLPSQQRIDIQLYTDLFNKAELLFNGPASDSTDSVALNYYTQVINAIKPGAINAVLLYNCYERSGILKQGLSYSSENILQDYYAGLALQKNFHLDDSILFRLLLSAGNIHYTDALFDSAVFYFVWAEKIIDQHPGAGLPGDLYNSLGAIYSEAGNYIQSGIYFNKALELTKRDYPELKEAIFAMSANIASAVRLSGNPDSALHLYKQLLDLKNPSAVIINNIGGIYLIKKEPDSALHYLQLKKNIQSNHGIAVYNAIAQAYMQKDNVNNAEKYLRFADSLYKSKKMTAKSNYHAATQKYFGDLMMLKNSPVEALHFYQQAIIQYDLNFNNTNTFSNPGNFIGEFTSYNLFDALIAKANCFTVLFHANKSLEYLNGALDTYDSAFVLSDYIKKSIDNDEARSFIADKVFTAYISAVDFLMASNNLNEDKLAHALKWISKSRATSLAINLKENKIRQYAGLPDSLLQKERSIKLSISRMKLQLQQTADAGEQSEIISDINSASLQLQSIENSFKKFKTYYSQKFAADNIDLSSIQKNIPNHQAAICYFNGAKKLYAFIIKKDKILEHEISRNIPLADNIEKYGRELSYDAPGRSYDAKPSKYLYNKLIQPLLSEIGNVSSIVIIPDQSLINIPFEALETNDGKYLVENFSVTYQYALPLLQVTEKRFTKNKTIAFAPFAYNNPNSTMSILPSSLEEVSQFGNGQKLTGAKATKNNFISFAINAAAIHLATHAVADFNEPENSYIAFFPYNKTDSSYKMFAHELYNIQLPLTQFVFLSACETGSGKLSQSEGVLSLSRAFAFAGCPNIVTSLWRAEDKATAYISERFYDYVSSGYTYAKALQKAKNDLLRDESMSQFHSPVYWAHLIFIGNIQKETSSLWIWADIACLIVMAFMMIVYRKRKVLPYKN